jgi:DNA gyrase subunit A
MAVSALRVMGRATQGVKLINLKQNDRIGAVEFVAKSEGDEEIESTNADEIEENSETSDQ